MTRDHSANTGTPNSSVLNRSVVSTPAFAIQRNDATFIASFEQLWNIYRLNQETIKFADTKAAAVLTADFAMAAAWASLSATHHNVVNFPHFVFWFFATSALCVLVSAGWCLWVVLPRLGGTESHRSIVYFKHIAEHCRSQDYRDFYRLTSLDAEAHEDQLIEQVWITSTILAKKFMAVRQSIFWMFPAIVFTVAAIVASNW